MFTAEVHKTLFSLRNQVYRHMHVAQAALRAGKNLDFYLFLGF